MHRRRSIATGLAALLALTVAPSGAGAATALLRDDSLADFAAGTTSNTWAVEPGTVALTRSTINESFDSDNPALWSPFNAAPFDGGTATVAGGTLTVDGARATSVDPPSLTAPQTLEFSATLGAQAYEHVGLGDTFQDGPWAMFSTGGLGMSPGLYARTLSAVSASAGGINTSIAGISPLVRHTYRIEWSDTAVRYLIDGNEVANHAVAITLPMRPVASDLTKGGASVKVDWLALGTQSAGGTYVSRVHDAGDARAVWAALSAAGGAAFLTRTGNTPTPDGSWSPFQALGGGGAVQSPPGRYLQYEVTLDPAKPTLDWVTIGYDIAAGPPASDLPLAGSVQVDRTAPKVTLSLLSARASKRGSVALRLRCPGESRCTVRVALKLGSRTLATGTAKVAAGKTATLRLRLSKAGQRLLARRGTLKVKAAVSATDAAGNRSSRTVNLRLRAPKR